MIVRKYLLTEAYPIRTRDMSLNPSSSSNKCLFDTEEELLQYANTQYYPNPMRIALVEGEVYGESWCRQFRDIKEHCGCGKDLSEELRKFKDLEFQRIMKLTNEMTNRTEKCIFLDHYKLQCSSGV